MDIEAYLQYTTTPLGWIISGALGAVLAILFKMFMERKVSSTMEINGCFIGFPLLIFILGSAGVVGMLILGVFICTDELCEALGAALKQRNWRIRNPFYRKDESCE